MITHRLQTQPPPEPPVRFYKIIALSFLAITVLLLAVVILTTTKKAAITIMAKEDAKTVNLTVGIDKEKRAGQTIAGEVSSTVFVWSETYYTTRSKTVEGSTTGEAIVYNKSNIPQPLVKTTRLLTPQSELFRLSEDIKVPANGQITAKIYPDKPGAAIGPGQFTIPGLSAARQKFVYAENTKAISGSARQVKILTEEDIAAAQANYLEKARQAFLDDKNTGDAWLNQKIIITSMPATAVSHQAGDETEEYKISGQNNITYLLFNREELEDLINKEIGGKIDLTSEKVLTVNKEPVITVLSHNPAQGTAQLSVAQEVAVTLESNSEKLAVSNFMGKNKADIERYLLGLNHVAGVEINFTPKWTRSAPSVADKIKIVVKNIK